MGRLWEQLLGNHSGCAESALSCSVPEYLSVPRESKGTKARAAGVTVRRAGGLVLFIQLPGRAQNWTGARTSEFNSGPAQPPSRLGWRGRALGLVADIPLPCPRAVDDDSVITSCSMHQESEAQRGLTTGKSKRPN